MTMLGNHGKTRGNVGARGWDQGGRRSMSAEELIQVMDQRTCGTSSKLA